MASISSYQTQAGERRYVVRFRSADGRHRGRSFNRKRDAENFRADIIRRKQLGPLYEAEVETLGAFIEGWQERYAQRVRKSSLARRVAALQSLPDSLRARPLVALSAAEVEDAVSAVAATAPRQAQLALASVKMIVRDATRRKHRVDPGILELSPPRSNGRPVRFLTWQEVQKLAEWLPDRHARLVMVAALSGLRRGEVMALKWGDVDLDAGTLVVRAGKTEAARRSVDLPATAVELLREQAKALSEGLSSKASHGIASLDASTPVAPGAGPSLSAPVFPNNRGGHLDGHNFYNRWFLPAARATGFEGFTFHELRHTYASLLAAANVNPKVAAGLLGHADGGALFLRRYSHLYSGAGRQAADALEESL
jgi:integrase